MPKNTSKRYPIVLFILFVVIVAFVSLGALNLAPTSGEARITTNTDQLLKRSK